MEEKGRDDDILMRTLRFHGWSKGEHTSRRFLLKGEGEKKNSPSVLFSVFECVYAVVMTGGRLE